MTDTPKSRIVQEGRQSRARPDKLPDLHEDFAGPTYLATPWPTGPDAPKPEDVPMEGTEMMTAGGSTVTLAHRYPFKEGDGVWRVLISHQGVTFTLCALDTLTPVPERPDRRERQRRTLDDGECRRWSVVWNENEGKLTGECIHLGSPVVAARRGSDPSTRSLVRVERADRRSGEDRRKGDD